MVPEPSAQSPLVVHAPSDRRVKGTEHVEAAVARLAEEGVPLEFELLQGVGHAEVRSALERSAIVVDQLNAGWYGGFAVEAMAIGRPVLAALDRRDDPVSPTRPPARSSGGRRLRRDAGRASAGATHSPDERRRLGAAGRSFVEHWHDPRAVARTVIATYRR